MANNFVKGNLGNKTKITINLEYSFVPYLINHTAL